MKSPKTNDVDSSAVPFSSPRQERTPKKSRGGWIFIIAALTIMGLVIFRGSGKSIRWVTDYQAGCQLAKKQDKPMLLSFFAGWAPHCEKMKQNTYNDPKIVDYINQHFIPIFLDVEKGENNLLANKYRIGIYPTQVIKWVDSDNFVTVPGNHPPENFISRLEEALKKVEKHSS